MGRFGKKNRKIKKHKIQYLNLLNIKMYLKGFLFIY